MEVNVRTTVYWLGPKHGHGKELAVSGGSIKMLYA